MTVCENCYYADERTDACKECKFNISPDGRKPLMTTKIVAFMAKWQPMYEIAREIDPELADAAWYNFCYACKNQMHDMAVRACKKFRTILDPKTYA